MIVWLLQIWLCASPGPSGECRPMPDRVFDTRAACLRAAGELRATAPRMTAHCHLRRPS